MVDGDIPFDELWTGEALAMQRIDWEDVVRLKTTKEM